MLSACFQWVFTILLCLPFLRVEASSLLSGFSCAEEPSPWHTVRQHENVAYSFFQLNLARRLCALQTGALDAGTSAVSLEPSTDWTWDALVLTSALTEAYTLNQRLQVAAGLPAAFQSGPQCKLADGCLFSSSLLQAGPAAAASTLWHRQRLIEHYLRGAGLLWLRRRTIDHTGCHLAAHAVGALLQPAGEFKELVTKITAQLQAAGQQMVCYNAVGRSTPLDLPPPGTGSIVLLGASRGAAADLLSRLGGRQLLLIEAPAGGETAAMAFALAHCAHYVGGLDERWVKIGLLLALSLYNKLPQLTAGASQWKDDFGFASCTAEEFRVMTRSSSGKKRIRDLLELPPQPPLPAWDYVSTRSGWSGRNSDPKLCKNVTFPPPSQAITVDQLLSNGQQVTYDCSADQPCPKALPLAPEVRGTYEFNGGFSEEQRDREYAGTAENVRCGFMAPSGFDLIRDYEPFHRCKVVVVNLVAKGRDVLLNVQNIAPHNIADPRVCFVSIMDINGMITHQQQLPPGGGLMTYGNWTIVALLNSPWEGTTDGYWIRGARDANVMRYLRFRTFPSAEYSMWIDGKHQLVVDPCTLFDQLLNQQRKVIANFHHENQRCVFVEHRIIKGLGWTSLIPGYRQLIQDTTDRYHREGMPSEAEGAPQGAYDLAVIISRSTAIANAYMCLAYAEVESFTSRNQLHYPYTVWRAKAKRFINEAPNCASWMYTKHVGHWSDHGGKFQV